MNSGFVGQRDTLLESWRKRPVRDEAWVRRLALLLVRDCAFVLPLRRGLGGDVRRGRRRDSRLPCWLLKHGRHHQQHFRGRPPCIQGCEAGRHTLPIVSHLDKAVIDSSVSFADKSALASSVSLADTSTIDSSVSFADTS